MKKTFRDLPKAQSAVFEQIACNNDAGHHPMTVQRLIQKGLVEERIIQDGPWQTIHYVVPTDVHMEWCQWCSQQMENEEHEA